jgi:methylphosphotriester-DNA--protein-cysteine methyltransferase
VLENLKLDELHDGFLFLAESALNPPVLKSHRHVELELNLVVDGTISYVVRGRRFTFAKRSLVWLFPAQEHQLVDRSPDARYYVAVFKPAMIRDACKGERYEALKRSNVKGGDVLQTVLEPASFDLVKATMDSMMAEAPDAGLLNREAGFGATSDFSFHHGDPDGLNASLRHLLLLCWRCHLEGKERGHAVRLHPAVLRAIALLSESAHDESLAALARRCGVSEAYLSRLFPRQMGISLNRYRNSVRLGKFLEIYRKPTTMTLQEAAFTAGFGSYARFYRVFSEAYGGGPRSAFRTPAMEECKGCV